MIQKATKIFYFLHYSDFRRAITELDILFTPQLNKLHISICQVMWIKKDSWSLNINLLSQFFQFFFIRFLEPILLSRARTIFILKRLEIKPVKRKIEKQKSEWAEKE